MTDGAARRATSYLPEVESLRGIAVALVFAFHVDGLVHVNLKGLVRGPVSPALTFVVGGHTGVDLFFVLSGFLLARPFLIEAAGGRRVDRWHYARRRARRILPLYYLAVTIAVVVVAPRPGHVAQWLSYALFLQGVPGLASPLQPFSGIWWSVATEVQFYLLLPCLAVALGRRGRLLTLVAAYVVAYAVYVAGAMPLGLDGTWLLGTSAFGRAGAFAGGMLVAWLFVHRGAELRDRFAGITALRRGGADVVLMAVLVALGCLLRWQHATGILVSDLPPFQVWRLLAGILWSAILFLVLLAPLRLRPLLANRPLILLGTISYSVYLVHYPLLYYALEAFRTRARFALVGWSMAMAWRMAATAGACLLLSALTYRLVERPFLARASRVDAAG